MFSLGFVYFLKLVDKVDSCFACISACLVATSMYGLCISLQFTFTVGLYMYLAVSVVHEIKDALGIYCFRSLKSLFHLTISEMNYS